MKIILLIEDNADIRENTAELLELAGFVVHTAANGQLGVAQALAARPDLVICDIMMPVLDGYGVLQIFNLHPRLAGVPFIFLTAKTERTDLRRGMELGADDYLTKPFDKAELLSAVNSRLARFQHLKPDYDLQAEGVLCAFLDDARAVGQLESLAVDRKSHPVRKKQVIYLEGDEASRVYFVQAGRVKTSKATDGGKELITGLYGPGEFFGYLPVLAHTPHADSAVAVDESALVYIPTADFAALLHRNAEVSRQFIRLLAGPGGHARRRAAGHGLQLHSAAGGRHPAAPARAGRGRGRHQHSAGARRHGRRGGHRPRVASAHPERVQGRWAD